MCPETGKDPFAYPKSVDKFVVVDSGNPMTAPDIVQRIILNRLEYEQRNKAKEAKELAAIAAAAKKETDGGAVVGEGGQTGVFAME